MNAEDLIALGLSEEQAQKVIAAIGKDYVAVTRFNELNEENKSLKQAISDRDKQLDELKQTDADGLKQQIESLQKQNKEAADRYAAELGAMKKDNAVEQALITAKAKNVKAVKALLVMDEISFEDGKLKGLDTQLEKLKSAEDTSFLFESDTSSGKSGFSGVKPGDAGGASEVKQEGRGAAFAQRYNLKMGADRKKKRSES